MGALLAVVAFLVFVSASQEASEAQHTLYQNALSDRQDVDAIALQYGHTVIQSAVIEYGALVSTVIGVVMAVFGPRLAWEATRDRRSAEGVQRARPRSPVAVSHQ
jgi:hypothetical protein